MSAAALEKDLRSLGVACTVEAREGLALLIPRGDATRLATPEIRSEAVRMAAARGFTHIAIELPAAGAQSSAPDRARR